MGKTEADLIAKGITPETSSWPDRSKHWFYAHGGSVDPQTWQCVVATEGMIKVYEDLVKAINGILDVR